ncbi:MAG TPA: DUF1289 domain-containing protein [Xanthobacteraceae bacterium]|nr:DUF1289 domain-containing protein [Xanthobacteraceae bacterium]
MSLIETPCINVCVVDRSGHCVGCGRSLSEIASWSTLSSEARRRIMTALPQRLETLGHRPPSRSSSA